MAPYLLVLWLSNTMSFPATTPVVIGMPSADECRAALKNWMIVGRYEPGRYLAGAVSARGYCITLNGEAVQ